VASPATNSGALSSFSFSRTVYLPEQVDGASIRAQLVDGILTVEIPKAAVSQPVEVQVL
jgi:HSP20 family molecular chaperone IbpA